MVRWFFFFLIISSHSPVYTQVKIANEYPQDYFRNPMNFPLEISGNFGELRTNHWHMGLDIRTNQKENQLVHAAAEGYIAFAGIRPNSFGRFIIINHPNGYSTLYAHLNDFYSELEQYVTQQQHLQESWAIELNIPPDLFKVHKGQFIAYSGNTGSSRGAHLHFEIFNTETGKRYNPLLFGLPIADTRPPTVSRLALYDRTKTLYRQSPKIFSLQKKEGGYSVSKTEVLKVTSPKISFAVGALDVIDRLPFTYGIYAAEMYVDNHFVSGFVLDNIDYTETRCMNAHIDYRTKVNGGSYLQHLSPLPGEISQVYQMANEDGVIHLEDTLVHTVSIRLLDAYNNATTIATKVQYIASPHTELGKAAWEEVHPNNETTIEKEGFKMAFQKNAVYDTLKIFHFASPSSGNYTVSDVHRMGESDLPLQQPVKVAIKINKEIPDSWSDKVVIKNAGRSVSFKKANLNTTSENEKWASAHFIQLGSYEALIDAQPPVINSNMGSSDTALFKRVNDIIFTPIDNTEIASFRAEINGKWVRFTNDKGVKWIYTFDEKVPYGTHHLKVIVTDIVGNKTEKEWWIKREEYIPPPPKKKPVRTKKAVKKKARK